jgi:hypothetical protein
LLLGCPLRHPNTQRAEEVLDEFIQCATGYRHDFMREHQEYGLPQREQIETWLQEEGFDYRCLANGFLPRWLFMQCVTFYISTLQDDRLAERINRYYNQSFYAQDNREPAYRRLFIVDISRSGQLLEFDRRLPAPAFQAQEADSGIGLEQAQLLLQLINMRLLQSRKLEVQRLDFLLAARENYITDLRRHIANLENIERARVEQVTRLEQENGALRQQSGSYADELERLRKYADDLRTAHEGALQQLSSAHQSLAHCQELHRTRSQEQAAFSLQLEEQLQRQVVGRMEKQGQQLAHLQQQVMERMEKQGQQLELLQAKFESSYWRRLLQGLREK